MLLNEKIIKKKNVLSYNGNGASPGPAGPDGGILLTIKKSKGKYINSNNFT